MDKRNKYENSRKRLEVAIESGQRPELESALDDFEAMLVTEEMRKREKIILDRASVELINIEKREGEIVKFDDKNYLRTICRIKTDLFKCFINLAI